MIVTKRYTFREKFSWALYDWANSVYSLVISTAIFPIYYSEYIFANSDSIILYSIVDSNLAKYLANTSETKKIPC